MATTWPWLFLADPVSLTYAPTKRVAFWPVKVAGILFCPGPPWKRSAWMPSAWQQMWVGKFILLGDRYPHRRSPMEPDWGWCSSIKIETKSNKSAGKKRIFPFRLIRYPCGWAIASVHNSTKWAFLGARLQLPPGKHKTGSRIPGIHTNPCHSRAFPGESGEVGARR